MLLYQIIILLLVLLFCGMVFRNLQDYAVLPEDTHPPRPDEKLFVLIPARNEAANIEACLEGLLAQSHSNFKLLVLDDSSEDGTAQIVETLAERDSRVRLLRGKPIEAGWAGKVWACSQLGEEALNQGADWLFFLDADTRTQPGFLKTALAHAQETGADMVSSFPYQTTGTFWERVVLTNLHFLITTFLPVRMVWESPIPSIVAACGQVELISASDYRKSGGHAGIPTSFHDGLQLARKIKLQGGKIRLFDASALISCRMYHGGAEVWKGFTRNAYEGVGSLGALIVMSALQLTVYLAPYVFLGYWLFRWAQIGHAEVWGWLCVAQVALVLWQRLMQARRFGHYESILLHPLSILSLIVIQWGSFFKSKQKAKVVWKGRTY